MGHRANYIIINEGNTEIYESGWGALSIAHDIFFGPVVTAAFMRAHLTGNELYDEVWCEGAALLDLTQKKLMFFSWYDLKNPLVVKHYTALLQRNYPGWRLEVANEGIREICAYIGGDLSKVVSEYDEIDDEDIIGQEDEAEPAISTDDQAITVVEQALLSANAKSINLQKWLQRNFSEIGLTKVASLFVRVNDDQVPDAQHLHEMISQYRASLKSEQFDAGQTAV